MTSLLILMTTLVAGAELLGRRYGLGKQPLYRADPTVEYLLQPNQDIVRRGKVFRTNSHGMRSPELASKAPGELRIAVFGDSVVNGGSRTSQEELATSLVQYQLQNVTVCNISAGSWDPGNWLAYAREYGFHDADIVVLVISSHDAHDVPTFLPLERYCHPTKRQMALTELCVKLKQRAMPSAAPPVTKGAAIPCLKAFLLLAKSNGRNVYVLQHLAKSEHLTPESGYWMIASTCRDVGIEPRSLKAAFEANLDAYRDDLHPNAKGQTLIASAIISSIRGSQRGAQPFTVNSSAS